jgi:hypothetical protein
MNTRSKTELERGNVSGISFGAASFSRYHSAALWDTPTARFFIA